MVAANAGRHIGIELLTAQARAMAVLDQALEGANLVHDNRVAVDHAGEVHYFGQTQHIFFTL